MRVARAIGRRAASGRRGRRRGVGDPGGCERLPLGHQRRRRWYQGVRSAHGPQKAAEFPRIARTRAPASVLPSLAMAQGLDSAKFPVLVVDDEKDNLDAFRFNSARASSCCWRAAARKRSPWRAVARRRGHRHRCAHAEDDRPRAARRRRPRAPPRRDRHHRHRVHRRRRADRSDQPGAASTAT